ncbi:twin-arginine translocation signal domain-containing protein, partial [Mesorhizobium sp.]
MSDKKISRRGFLEKSTAITAGAAAATTLSAPAVLAQAPVTIKMQTSWPASDIWMDFARLYIERVEKMSGGRLK